MAIIAEGSSEMEEHVNRFNEWIVSDGDELLDGCSLEELDMMGERVASMIDHLSGKYESILYSLGQLADIKMREVAREGGAQGCDK